MHSGSGGERWLQKQADQRERAPGQKSQQLTLLGHDFLTHDEEGWIKLAS